MTVLKMKTHAPGCQPTYTVRTQGVWMVAAVARILPTMVLSAYVEYFQAEYDAQSKTTREYLAIVFVATLF